MFQGKVAYVSPSLDPTMRTFAVEAIVDNRDRRLKPGFFAKGVILTRKDEGVMAVPDSAVSTLAGVSSVYIVKDGKITQQPVTLGVRQGDLWEIVDGLKGDETLASSRLNELATGVSIEIDKGSPARAVRAAAARAAARAARAGQRQARGRSPVKLADVSVRRPVFAVMMSAALIVLGWFSYRDLGLDLMPRTDSPTVNVRAGLNGASAEEVETTITKPIEAAVNTINGIDELRCSSNQGNGSCTITFTLERDIEAATQDVRDKVATVRFPRDTEPAVVSKIDPDAAPVLTLVVFSNRSPKEITQIADKQIEQVLETVQDVGEVQFWATAGARFASCSTPTGSTPTASPSTRSATPSGGRTAKSRAAVSSPARPRSRCAPWGGCATCSEFEKIVLSYKEGSVITLGDVARVTDANEEVRSQTRLDGENAVSMWIRKQSGSNTVTVVDRVLARLEGIQATLPSDIKVKPTRDQSRFIRKSFEEIQLHLILGGVLAALVVFLFIRNLRARSSPAGHPGLDHRDVRDDAAARPKKTAVFPSLFSVEWRRLIEH